MGKSAGELYLDQLAALAAQHEYIASRREQLALVAALSEQAEQGASLKAVLDYKGVFCTMADVGSETPGAFVWNTGRWALGFEGESGELVIFVDHLVSVRPNRSGLEFNLETGEQVWLGFHGSQQGGGGAGRRPQWWRPLGGDTSP